MTPDARQLAGERVVVCLGDSITRGQVSSNYVRRLQGRPHGARPTRFVNAGVNGDLAYNVAARLDDVIALQPDVVTLLVGTNDVNAHYDATWAARYRKDQRLPVAPALDWYAEQVDTILRRLRSETTAAVAVLDIPPLGEDLASRMNRLVADHNAVLRETAARHGVPCLPLHDSLVALLPADHAPAPYTGRMATVMTAGAQHLLLRRRWDRIARSNGLALLTDHIHLGDRAADVVAGLVGDFLATQQ